MSIHKTAEFLRKNNNFLITSHTTPEGDAIGSELGLYRLLKALGKNVFVINEDDLPYGYEFLPDVDKIQKFHKDKKRVDFDALVAVDCSDLRRTGEVYTLNSAKKPIINIDHHISNEKFGYINWVDPSASCCAEMIFRLYKKMRVPLDKNSALLLYAGILTDTGSFKYSNTTVLTHKIAAELLGYGIDFVEVFKNIYENVPFDDMQLLGSILPNMKRTLDGKIIWFQIKKDLLKNHKEIHFDLTEHILSFGRAVKGKEVVVLFKENLGDLNEVRVNFRSQGHVDVNKIAGFFGGGGHKTASGCTIKGKIEDVSRKVLAKIKSEIKRL